jgi:hypothetical protein
MTRSFVPRRAPQGTVGHAVVEANLEAWLDWRERMGRRVPRYVKVELRDYLRCGDPEFGFRTLACPTGHYSRYVPECCKGRGFCPYCLTIRQRELGERLINRVIGNVPVRHTVFCFPPQLRYVVGYDEALLTGGFRALATAVFEYQRSHAAELFDVPRERIHAGGIVVNHRVSASLATNHHFHGIFPDGVFVEVEPGVIEFRRLPPPTEQDVVRIAYAASVAFCEALKARGFWETTSTSSDTVEGILKLPNRRSQVAKFFAQAAKDAEGGVAPRDGAYAFHVFVGNAIEVQERLQLEHLVNYILAPPFKDRQLELMADGKVRLWLKRDRHDGTAYVDYTPYEFLDRLAELVPRPNVNTLRYYGIYAPNAHLRRLAVALRLTTPRVVTGCAAEAMVCPICARKLRVVAVVKGRHRTPAAIPPDTPGAPTPHEGDRIGKRTVDDRQGRLFD